MKMKVVFLLAGLLVFRVAQSQQPAVLQNEPSTPGAMTLAAPSPAVTDAERAAVLITRLDLDCHLTPAAAGEEVSATLTVRNVSAAPLTRISLQISGSLRWTSLKSTGAKEKATETAVPSDTDHTGLVEEATLPLAEPLQPGASMTLTGFYSGKIEQSSARLEALGAEHGRAAQTEWDQITQTSDEGSTALRGFGDVLWYPVAAPTAALGEGNRLFELIARERRRNAAMLVSLRLTVEYMGDPPESAIFNGGLRPLDRHPDSDLTTVDETHGLATAEYAAAPLGVRSMSLFLTAQRASPAAGQILSVITPVPDLIDPYAAAATQLEPLMTGWFGPAPTQPLLLLDHPGAPFEDDAFLVAHLAASAEPQAIAPELVRGVTHAWFRPVAPADAWLDEGMAELMGLLWTEQTAGRAAALRELRDRLIPLPLAEPDLAANAQAAGQPLVEAWSDVYLRVKSAAVLWQLRELLGDEAFKAGVMAFRHSLVINPTVEKDPAAFRKALERAGNTELGWFFADWVDHDHGLPDLTVVRATARPQLTAKSQIEGYLVAVEVKNDGDAVADVPVTVRSSEASIKDRVRVLPHASASVRIFFRGRPDSVEVNDGSVPEQRTSVHTAELEVL